ncbi:hypothetical protein JCM3774_000589 [Rhodotorula dairenensis]
MAQPGYGHGFAGTAAGGSGSTTPAGGATRSGRVVKPVKPYTAPVQPPRGSMSRQQGIRGSSAAAPHRQSYGGAVPAGPPPPPQRHPLALTLSAVPPMTRITGPGNEGKQAMFTTYPARMRLGMSTLMQPNAFAGPAASSATPGGGAGSGAGASGTGGANTPIVPGKRQRSTINYADFENLDDYLLDGDDGDEAQQQPASARAKRGHSSTPAAIAAGQQQQGRKAQAAPTAPAKPEFWGDGKSYLGTLPPGNLVQVQPVKTTKHLAFTEDQLEEHAERRAALVPVQIDLDVDTFKIRDTFVWNVQEKLITPAAFARVFCDDLDIDQTPYAKLVEQQITQQVHEQTGVALFPLLSEEEEAAHIEKDWRVVINLDVQIGTLHLTDRFDWDLSSSLTPELFAATLARDLSLSSNAAPLIAAAVHAELFRIKRSFYELGLLTADEALRARRGPKPLEGAWREWNEANNYGPEVKRMTLDELDRVEHERERAARRAKKDRIGAVRVAQRPRR